MLNFNEDLGFRTRQFPRLSPNGLKRRNLAVDARIGIGPGSTPYWPLASIHDKGKYLPRRDAHGRRGTGSVGWIADLRRDLLGRLDRVGRDVDNAD